MRMHAAQVRSPVTPGAAARAPRAHPAVRAVLRAPRIQPKLKIGAVNDPAEREADRVADQVMRMGNPSHVAVSEPSGSRDAPVRRLCTECEREEAHRRPGNGAIRRADKGEENERLQASERQGTSVLTPAAARAVGGLGGGFPLSSSDRPFFERRFGHAFDSVRVHAGANADIAASLLNARAFTIGNEIAFAKNEYSPGTTEGRKLLAHELTHVVQQQGSTPSLQRAWVADTGWRYAPPATVTRSIEEIQAIVGVTPDGVYGPNTRNAVRRYQGQLQSQGLYSGTLDGKWGNGTELGHVDFATGNESETYNCSGLAFKRYTHIGMADTETHLAGMTQLSSCSDSCNPREFKFWHWSYDVSLTDMTTGMTGPSHRDFHIVGGQTDGSGNGPAVVVSKNGRRPIEGPAAPASWRPVSEWARSNDHSNTVSTQFWKNRTNHVERCFCAASLP
jgi:hypothetical protein